VLGQQRRNIVRILAGMHRSEFAPQQQATRGQDVLIVVDDKYGPGFHGFEARIVFEIVHSVSASVQFLRAAISEVY
jgi:hypothetical protein